MDPLKVFETDEFKDRLFYYNEDANLLFVNPNAQITLYELNIKGHIIGYKIVVDKNSAYADYDYLRKKNIGIINNDSIILPVDKLNENVYKVMDSEWLNVAEYFAQNSNATFYLYNDYLYINPVENKYALYDQYKINNVVHAKGNVFEIPTFEIDNYNGSNTVIIAEVASELTDDLYRLRAYTTYPLNVEITDKKIITIITRDNNTAYTHYTDAQYMPPYNIIGTANDEIKAIAFRPLVADENNTVWYKYGDIYVEYAVAIYEKSQLEKEIEQSDKEYFIHEPYVYTLKKLHEGINVIPAVEIESDKDIVGRLECSFAYSVTGERIYVLKAYENIYSIDTSLPEGAQNVITRDNEILMHVLNIGTKVEDNIITFTRDELETIFNDKEPQEVATMSDTYKISGIEWVEIDDNTCAEYYVLIPEYTVSEPEETSTTQQTSAKGVDVSVLLRTENLRAFETDNNTLELSYTFEQLNNVFCTIDDTMYVFDTIYKFLTSDYLKLNVDNSKIKLVYTIDEDKYLLKDIVLEDNDKLSQQLQTEGATTSYSARYLIQFIQDIIDGKLEDKNAAAQKIIELVFISHAHVKTIIDDAYEFLKALGEKNADQLNINYVAQADFDNTQLRYLYSATAAFKNTLHSLSMLNHIAKITGQDVSNILIITAIFMESKSTIDAYNLLNNLHINIASYISELLDDIEIDVVDVDKLKNTLTKSSTLPIEYAPVLLILYKEGKISFSSTLADSTLIHGCNALADIYLRFQKYVNVE